MKPNDRIRAGLKKGVVGATILSLSGFGSVARVDAFTRVQAQDLSRRLSSLGSIDGSVSTNLFTVAQEMNRVSGSHHGPVAIAFAESLMMQFVGSFGVGEDYASLDILSVKDIGYGNMLEGGLPLISFQKDWNPGIFANFGYNDKDGLNLDGPQFAEMMGTAPVALSSYVIGTILVAAVGVSVVAASSGGSSDTSQAQSQTAQPQTAEPQTAEPQTAESQTAESQTAQPQTAESPSASALTLQLQTSGQELVTEQPQTQSESCPECDLSVAGDTGDVNQQIEKEKSNNKYGDKNQPVGIAGGFKHNK